MQRIAIAVLASISFGGCAVAAERAHGEHCTRIADLTAHLTKRDKIEILKPGAFHLAEGLWMATPPLSAKTPDVDGAALLTIDNENSLVFTSGKEGCIASIPPFHVPAQWVRALSSAKTAPGEKAEPKDEMSL